MFARFWRFDRLATAAVMRLALPISATALAESGLFAASAFMMGWLGHLELAAHGIVLQLAALSFMVHLGLSQAGTVLVGKAFARRDWAAVQRIAAITMVLSTLAALVAILFFGHTQYADQCIFRCRRYTDPEILRIGTLLLIVAAMFQFVDAAQVVALSLCAGFKIPKCRC